MKKQWDKQPLPILRTDAEAEAFVAESDLTQYDLSGFRPMNFEIQHKTRQVNLRMPDALLLAVKQKASERSIPYQRFIREAIENALR